MKARLFLVDRLAVPIARMGVDYKQFRALLAVKLMLDGRRQHGWVQGTKRMTPLTWSLIVHAAMGVGVAFLPFMVASPLTAITLGLSVVMVMLAFDLVADYSGVLLDATETTVLAARPVTSRTLLAARLAHIGNYLAMYVGALAAATCIAGTLRWGVRFLPAYLVSLLQAVVLVLAAVVIVYLVLMRVMSRERLRDAIMYAQLAMTVLTVSAYYMSSAVDLRGGPPLEDRPWIYFYPPAWLAGLPALALGRTDAVAIILCVAGWIAVLLLAFLAVRLAPGFRVAGAGEGAAGPAPRSSRVAPLLARWMTSSAAGRAVFELVWALASRDRPFKTRTYPALLAIVLFVVAFTSLARSGVWGAQFQQTHANMHLFFLYYAILVIPTPILMVIYADRPEAGWVYRGMPIDRPGTALVAGLQVLFIRYVLPVFATVAALVLSLWGWRVILDVALALAVSVLVTFCFGMVTGRRLPFSAPPPGGASGTTAGAVVGGMGLVLVLGVAHWLLLRVETLPQPWPVISAIPVILILAWLASRACAATRWGDIRNPVMD
jgi:hypothetical protein